MCWWFSLKARLLFLFFYLDIMGNYKITFKNILKPSCEL